MTSLVTKPFPSSTAIPKENKCIARGKSLAARSSSHNSSKSVISDGTSKTEIPVKAGELDFLAAFAAQCQPCEKFDNLPFYLKENIWDLSLYPMAPRLVMVHYNVQTGRFYTTTPTPAQFKICKQSRNVAKQYYNIYFNGLGPYGHPASIQINTNVDTIQLNWDPLRLRVVDEKVFENLRHLELAGKDLQREEQDMRSILKQLRRFRSLETITIVSPPPSSSSSEMLNDRYGVHWLRLAHLLEFDVRRRTSCRIRSLILTGLRAEAKLTGGKVPQVLLVITNSLGVREEAAEALDYLG